MSQETNPQVTPDGPGRRAMLGGMLAGIAVGVTPFARVASASAAVRENTASAVPAYSATKRYVMAGGYFSNYYDGAAEPNDSAFPVYQQWCDDSTSLGFTTLDITIPWVRVQPTGPTQFDFTWIDQYLDYAIRVRDRYVLLIVDETGVSAPAWIDAERFAQRTPQGDIETSHGTFPVYTLNNPEFNAYVTNLYRAIGEHVLDRYGISNFLGFQNVTWPNMESTYPDGVAVTDYSDSANKAFRGWARRQYASIKDVNNRWGTSYATFADVAFGIETAAKETDARKFRAWALAEHMRVEYETVKSIDPRLAFVVRSGGDDNWATDEHGEKSTMMAARWCDVLGEDNEYLSPAVYPVFGSMAADLNFYRTGARIRGINWDMEMDYLDMVNNTLGETAMNVQYENNGAAGFRMGAQIINVCHWEHSALADYADAQKWSFIPTLSAETQNPVARYGPDKAMYYSYWGGLVGQEADLRATYDQATNDGAEDHPLDVLNILQYADIMYNDIAQDRFWLKYRHGIWIPDSRVLAAVEREMLTRAFNDGIVLSFANPGQAGTFDEYGRSTPPLVAELSRASTSSGIHYDVTKPVPSPF